MLSALWLLSLVHLFGFALGVGGAVSKSALLLKTRGDAAYLAAFLRVSKVLTRVIITGLLLLVASGAGWLVLGVHDLSPRLIVKLSLVAAIFVLGPVIDNVLEPRFRKLAPAPGETPSPEFLDIQRRYLVVELTATMLFIAITVLWLAP